MRWRFFLTFAWRDLTDKYARRTSLVLVATTAFVCAFTLLVYGFALGFERVSLHRLAADPLALCLWTGDSLVTKQLTPEVLQELRRQLDGQAGAESARVFPFRQTEFFWLNKKQGWRVPIRGRTLVLGEPTDPLFQSRPLRSGQPFRGPDDEGVIVTPTLLTSLGYAPEQPPDFIQLASKSQLIDVRVLGVTQQDLPLFHDFVIPERYEHLLRHADPDPALALLFSGPLPDDFPENPKDLPKSLTSELQALLTQHKVEFPKANFGKAGDAVWHFKAQAKQFDRDNPGPRRSEWKRLLEEVGRLLGTYQFKVGPEFVDERDERGQVKPLPPLPVAYDRAGIYVTDVKSLPAVAEACERVKAGSDYLKVNHDIVDRIASVGREKDAALGILSFIEGVILIIAVWNMYVIQALRWQQKQPEIGMLKAMGMTSRQLLTLCLVEGTLIWWVAALVGTGAGLAAGYAGAAWWYEGDGELTRLGFFWSWPMLAAVFVGSGFISLTSSWLTTRRACQAAPAATLQLH